MVGKAGIDRRQYVDILTSTLFGAPVYKTYGALIAEERYQPAGFKAELGYKDVQLALLRRALAGSPRDAYLHEAYQRIRLQGPDVDRAGLVSEDEALLVKNPRDPLFLYLAARAEAGFTTKDAIAKLQDSIELVERGR